jgi:hypothetical protein
VWPLYAVAAFQGGISAVDAPGRSSLPARLLPAELIPSASALGQLAMNASTTVGPLLAGVLIAALGLSTVYMIDFFSFGFALYSIARLGEIRPAGGGRRVSLQSIGEGLTWLKSQPAVLMTYLLDLNAMIFGMPRALFPALAVTQFHGGATTTGFLYAAPAIGAMLGALFSGPVGRIKKRGATIIAAIGVWGLAIMGFGFSHTLWLGLLFLAIAGAADLVSAVHRSTILQLAAPDEMRGRLYGVFIIVVTGGPRLGDAEAGAMAAVTSVTVSAWSGGLFCLIGLAALVASVPSFVGYTSPQRAAERRPE